MTTYLLATRSAGKLRELEPLFVKAGLRVTTLDRLGVAETAEEEEVEAFATFEENALAKARHFAVVSGLPTLADDSGLAVESLGGAPGVRSKRWSGRADLRGQALDDANNAALMAALAGHTNRAARYVCVAAFVDDRRELVRRGEVAGEVLHTPRGEGGFGYDPYFLSDELRITFGEASLEAKETVSHRGRAFRALLAALRGG